MISEKNSVLSGEKWKIFDLLNNRSRIFTIPPFQRNYDWNKKSCLTLIKDLEKNFNSPYSYYINQLVYKIESNEIYTRYSLIDGQQRLTTIFLILSSIHNNLKDNSLKKVIEKDLLFNEISNDIIEFKSKMEQTSDDKETFENIIINNFSNIDKKSNIYKRYIDINAEICKWDEAKLKTLYNEIKETTYTKIEINNNADPKLVQRIFEKMNSAGQELKGSDLIRNYLLMPFDNNKQKELYKNYWKEIEKNTIYSDEENKKNVIEDFFRVYLISETGKEVKNDSKSLYLDFVSYFENAIKSGNEDIVREIKKICEYSVYYSQLLNANTNNVKINDLILRINKLDIQAVYPFYIKLFALYNNQLINEKDIIEVFSSIENYIARRYLAPEYSTKNYNKIFCNIYNKVVKECEKFTPDNLRYYLLKLEQTNKYPSDEEVKIGIENKNIYWRKKNNPIAQFILERINHYSNTRESSSTKDIYDKYSLCSQADEHGISIEHIMPKGDNDDKISNREWKKYLGKDGTNDFFAKWVHKLANLTLTGYNSEISDNLFIEHKKKNGKINNKKGKRDFYKESGLPINKYFEDVRSWKRKDIEKRNEYLSDLILKRVWKKLDSSYKIEYKCVTLEDIISESFDCKKIIDNIEVMVKFDDAYIFEKKLKKIEGKELMIEVFRRIYGRYSSTIDQLIVDNAFSELTEEKKATSSADSVKVSDKVYLDVHSSTERKFDFFERLFRECEIDYNKLQFYMKSNS